MGFFSSRKTDDTTYVDDGRSGVHVVRSRFYGRYKGKERDILSELSPHLSSPTMTEDMIKPSVHGAHSRPANNAHSRDPRSYETSISLAGSQANTRTSADPITSTLARQLNELAAANSEGLLDDDEYRLLRQDLFSRLTSSTLNPHPENRPGVSGVVPAHHRLPSLSKSHAQKRMSSHIHHDITRAPSIRSQSSISSTLSNIIRRVSSRGTRIHLGGESTSDVSSIFSLHSSRSTTYPDSAQMTGKLDQDISVQTRYPHLMSDSLSLSSHQSGNTLNQRPLPSSSSLRSRLRMGASNPPSSFASRVPSLEFHHSTSALPHGTLDDENLRSVHDIQEEIDALNAEGDRLMDAFNSLEISTLTKSHGRPAHSSSMAFPRLSLQVDEGDDTTGAHQDDADVSRISIDASGPSSLSNRMINNRSPRSDQSHQAASERAKRTTGPGERRELSSPMPDRRRLPPGGYAPQSEHPYFSSSLGSQAGARRSALRLPVPLDPLEEDPEILALDSELQDIRRRKDEVGERYKGRLDYLRALLKSAELRERLRR